MKNCLIVVKIGHHSQKSTAKENITVTDTTTVNM